MLIFTHLVQKPPWWLTLRSEWNQLLPAAPFHSSGLCFLNIFFSIVQQPPPRSSRNLNLQPPLATNPAAVTASPKKYELVRSQPTFPPGGMWGRNKTLNRSQQHGLEWTVTWLMAVIGRCGLVFRLRHHPRPAFFADIWIKAACSMKCLKWIRGMRIGDGRRMKIAEVSWTAKWSVDLFPTRGRWTVITGAYCQMNLRRKWSSDLNLTQRSSLGDEENSKWPGWWLWAKAK